jgi:hypothetical protein
VVYYGQQGDGNPAAGHPPCPVGPPPGKIALDTPPKEAGEGVTLVEIAR